MLDGRLQLLEELLRNQIVDAHIALRRENEKLKESEQNKNRTQIHSTVERTTESTKRSSYWFRRMKRDGFDAAFLLAERRLRSLRTDSM